MLNKKTRTALLITMIISIFPFSVFPLSTSQTLKDLLPNLSEADEAALLAGELLASDTTIAGSIKYAPLWMPTPSTGDGQSSTGTDSSSPQTKETESFTVEAVSLVPLPDYLQESSENEKMLHILNTLRAVSTQEGITYISFRRGNTPHPLFTKSYHVERVGSRSRLEDPVLDELAPKFQDIVFQRDTSFAGNFYEHTYTIYKNNIYLTVDNLTNLAVYGLIPAVPKQTLRIAFGITIVEEGVLCYSQAHITGQKPKITFLGFSVHLPSAFQRRITSLQEWFSDNIS